MARARRVRIEWLRRSVQLVFLALFVVLVVGAPVIESDLAIAQLFTRFDPLVGLTTIVAARALIAYSLFSLITVAVTLLLGRVWCGWVCPIGTVLDLVPGTARTKRAVPSWWRFGKYVTLAVALGAAAFGTLAPMILDPITIGMRPLQELVMPIFGSNAVGLSVGATLSRDALGLVAYLSLVPLAIVVGLNWVAKRFWCSSLCPLGGMLALLSRVSWIGRRVDAEACTSCGRCAKECPTLAIDREAGWASDPADCIVCMHCSDRCPSRAIRLRPSRTWPEAFGYVPERRDAIALAGATAASVATVLVLPSAVADATPLRPPSTDEDRLASLCVRCGACYSACPTGALRPSTSLLTESGLWTPMLEERPAHCTLNCNLCAEVCPTDALHTLSVTESALLGLGAVAHVNRNMCVAWAKGRDCMECQAVCPISGAIYSTHEMIEHRGQVRDTRVPHVNTDLCVGCEQCTVVCPAPMPAIVVHL